MSKTSAGLLRIAMAGAALILAVPAHALDVRAAMKSRYDSSQGYSQALLKLILDKSGVPYTISFTDVGVATQAREVDLLLKNERINIGWFGTSAELERQLVPVRYPIWRGLLGYRVFLIRKDQQPRFDQVKSLEDLRRFRGDQGIGWSDIAILENSGLKQEAATYETILARLNGGRSDYFARGVTEAFRELDEVGKDYPDLAVEQHILLVYPFAAFFFTNKENPELAKALEDGFRKAYSDGSFLKFFDSNPAVRNVLAKANLKGRLRIDIPNPLLTPETRAIPEKFWNAR